MRTYHSRKEKTAKPKRLWNIKPLQCSKRKPVESSHSPLPLLPVLCRAVAFNHSDAIETQEELSTAALNVTTQCLRVSHWFAPINQSFVRSRGGAFLDAFCRCSSNQAVHNVIGIHGRDLSPIPKSTSSTTHDSELDRSPAKPLDSDKDYSFSGLVKREPWVGGCMN
jgi:hypothetical protein